MKSKLYLGSLRGSLMLLALLPVLPVFAPWHLKPIASFHAEWLALIVGLLAGLVLVPVLLRAKVLLLPRMVLLPLGLMAFIAVQAQLLPQVVSEHAQMAMLYLLWAALLMALIGVLQEQVGRVQVSVWLAGGLMVAASSSALWESIFRLNGILGWWGGTTQANHYGDLLALGLASALYLLTVVKPARRGYLLMLAAVIVLGLSLTPSRSVWLYWLAMLLLVWRWQRSALRGLLVGFVLYVLLQALWSSGLLPAQQTAVERLYQQIGGAPVRLHIWQVAWQLFLQTPWLGQGFGQFDWAYFQAGQHIPELGNSMEHAHNLILHLLAELGIVPVLLLLALLGLWVRPLLAALNQSGHKQSVDSSNSLRLWLLMLMAILGLHSLLEYPLWYAQFLGVAAMMLALGDDCVWPVRLSKAGTWAVSGLLLMAVTVAGVHEWQYAKVEQALDSYSTQPSQQKINRFVSIVQQANVLAPLLNPYLAVMFTLVGDPANEKLRPDLTVLVNASYRFFPANVLAFRQAELQALNGESAQAIATLDLALKAYPDWAEAFITELDKLNAADQPKMVLLRGMAGVVASQYSKSYH